MVAPVRASWKVLLSDGVTVPLAILGSSNGGPQPQQFDGVPPEDLAAVLRGERHLIDGSEGVADVARAAFGVERHVGGKQQPFDAEEGLAAFDGRPRAKRRCVGVETA